MKSLLKDVYTSFVNTISPPFCAFCARWLPQRFPLCSACLAHIKPIVSHSISINAHLSLTVYALSAYENPLRKLILAKNSSNIIAAHQLGVLMTDNFPLALQNIDIIVPLPLHWTRYAWRGFNQAEIIAQTIADYHHKPSFHLLKRKQRTLFQASLRASERAKNVKNAFELSNHAALYTHKHILLIDDLMTTGATLHAACQQLVSLKPASLSALVACRVL
jgi:ComF family protein